MSRLETIIRDVPDFPKPGIVFKDITPVLSDPEAFAEVTEALAALTQLQGATHIVGVEARGFIFGCPVATQLMMPFVPARKPGKLPCETASVEYALEYGTDTIEIHRDAFGPGDRVVVIDDLLATGGTAEAVCKLIEQMGAEVAAVLVVIELTFLNGAEKLAPHKTYSLVRY